MKEHKKIPIDEIIKRLSEYKKDRVRIAIRNKYECIVSQPHAVSKLKDRIEEAYAEQCSRLGVFPVEITSIAAMPFDWDTQIGVALDGKTEVDESNKMAFALSVQATYEDILKRYDAFFKLPEMAGKVRTAEFYERLDKKLDEILYKLEEKEQCEWNLLF